MGACSDSVLVYGDVDAGSVSAHFNISTISSGEFLAGSHVSKLGAVVDEGKVLTVMIPEAACHIKYYKFTLGNAFSLGKKAAVSIFLVDFWVGNKFAHTLNAQVMRLPSKLHLRMVAVSLYSYTYCVPIR